MILLIQLELEIFGSINAHLFLATERLVSSLSMGVFVRWLHCIANIQNSQALSDPRVHETLEVFGNLKADEVTL
jgi:hypothetical protein